MNNLYRLKYYEPEFLGIIERKNITSPLDIKNIYIHENKFLKMILKKEVIKQSSSKDNYKILKNTNNFLKSVCNIINNKKRKRNRYENDITKIRCKFCKRDITKMFNSGRLYNHKCFKN